MKKFIFALMLVSSAAQAAPFAKGNADNGKKLFDKNNCNSCHAKMVEGGGDAVFTRPEHKVRRARYRRLSEQTFLQIQMSVTSL